MFKKQDDGVSYGVNLCANRASSDLQSNLFTNDKKAKRSTQLTKLEDPIFRYHLQNATRHSFFSA
ncbi:hypothetical protein M514_17755 [Trichuris suis]|nr:hypothetical protein M514_17755 [Trichuris suis]